MGSEIGSWAYSTISERLPAIARRVITENDLPPEIGQNLETLAQELNNGFIRHLQNDRGWDLSAWNEYLEPYLGKTWLDIPWYFAEAYFYRRILEATHYFQPGELQLFDPFKHQKRLGLEIAKESIEALTAKLDNWINPQSDQQGKWQPDDLIAMLYLALWGNRVDLSLWPVEAGDRVPYAKGDRICIDVDSLKANLLVDVSPILVEKMTNWRGVRIDLIADNAGFELFGDLCLIDFLLANKIADSVCLHLKPYPTFVSDATIGDVRETVEFVTKQRDPHVRAFASRLQYYITSGRLRLLDDWFWTSPLAFWEMPEDLLSSLAEASLIFIKGDANYRRLLGDRHWDFTTPFADIACYLPAPIVALRTLKAELAAGLQPSQIETLNREDPLWLTNGQWGVIQMSF